MLCQVPEVDVFCVPHRKMKALVNRSLRRYAEADFNDRLEPDALLVHLARLLDEIRKHEAIEECLIMKRLFDRVEGTPGPKPECYKRLKSEHTCVLPKITRLVARISDALSSQDIPDVKAVVGATYYVVLSLYLEHIVEEEGNVMSLLLQYFEKEELSALKQLVVDEHAKTMQGFKPTDTEKIFAEVEVDVDMKSAGGLPFESCEEAWSCLEASVGDDVQLKTMKPKTFENKIPKIEELPSLALENIFKFLEMPDILACALVCRSFAASATSPKLWREINVKPFVARGIVKPLLRILPLGVGKAVRKVTMAECDGLHQEAIGDLLGAVPNVEELDMSFSHAGDDCFARLPGGSLERLRKLDMSGCVGLTDHGLRLLSDHWRKETRGKVTIKSLRKEVGACDEVNQSLKGLEYLSLSGCCRVSRLDDLAASSFATRRLQYLDLSGCYQLRGVDITNLVDRCPRLGPENLYYCDGITDGPFQSEANGCANLEDGRKICCLSRVCFLNF